MLFRAAERDVVLPTVFLFCAVFRDGRRCLNILLYRTGSDLAVRSVGFTSWAIGLYRGMAYVVALQERAVSGCVCCAYDLFVAMAGLTRSGLSRALS